MEHRNHLNTAAPPGVARAPREALVLREARDDDVAELAAIYAAAVRALGPDSYGPDAVAAWAAFADTPAFREFVLGPRTLIAKDATGILGFGGIEGSGHVRSLYVRPDRAREGIGSALLAGVLEIGRAAGARRFTTDASELGQALFERFGFRVVETEVVERSGARMRRYRMERPAG